MAGHRKWNEIKGDLSPERKARIERKKEALMAAMELEELRRARNVTQEELAGRLGTRQPNVSRMEKRADVHVSSLRQVIEALGGELRVVAHFPDGDVRIKQFERSGAA